MLHLNLSTVAAGVGLLYALPHVYGILKPSSFAAAMRRFPRSTPIGCVLTLGATVWFLYYVSLETVADFASMKPFLYLLFGAVGVGTCLFVRDFLAVRGLAVILLLGAKLITDTARVVDTDWRLVLVTLAYVWVFVGMWFTISPWRMRDLIEWATASEARTRLVSGLRLSFGVLMLALAVTAYK